MKRKASKLNIKYVLLIVKDSNQTLKQNNEIYWIIIIPTEINLNQERLLFSCGY